MVAPNFTQAYLVKSTIKPTSGMIQTFDWISRPDNIFRLIVFSERKLPAITGIVEDLEQNCGNYSDFPLSNPNNRRIIGRFIKFILSHFSWKVKESGLGENVRLREFARTKFFSTAAVYEKLSADEIVDSESAFNYSINVSII